MREIFNLWAIPAPRSSDCESLDSLCSLEFRIPVSVAFLSKTRTDKDQETPSHPPRCFLHVCVGSPCRLVVTAHVGSDGKRLGGSDIEPFASEKLTVELSFWPLSVSRPRRCP